MLKNKDLQQLGKIHTLLGMIWQYTIDTDNNDLYEQTGITIKDIHDAMLTLNRIHTAETVKHLASNEKSNAYNKAHPEKHRELQRRYNERNKERLREKRREYDREYKRRMRAKLKATKEA